MMADEHLPPPGLKARVKAMLRQHPVLALWVARGLASVMAIRAWPRRLHALTYCSVAGDVRVTGWRQVALGRNCVIGAGSWLNVNHRGDASAALRIGHDAFIGRRNFFTVGRTIDVGPYCLTASDCAFVGSSHHVADPGLPYIATGTTQDADIVVGANCFFGYRAAVLGHVRIGHGSIIGAFSVVRHDLPPFCVAVGNPARVIRRFDWAAGRWREADAAVDWTCPDEPTYLRRLQERHGHVLQPLSAARTWGGDI
ncbi:acyltransferase [Ideonella sp. 4Y11]|uniref:Acyltransferase n=1 Tax=Ideonella aquatica TaxID=2824119 RepID=A0A940YLW4_9BURK|nr:acyltransferase [Ideonella aquatica]MBQ0958343.1 acyltransferase [Ideonella aquatica]